MGRYNLHTHTYRCRHASGDIPELIEVAKENGYTTLGISEHTVLSDEKWPDMRLGKDDVDEYFSCIEKNRLKEEAKFDGIKLLAGLECEPLEEYFSFYKEIKDKYKVDFLLMANHFFLYEGRYITAFDDRFDIQRKIKVYAEHIIKGMESGLFYYLAHPDIFMTTKERWDSYSESVMKDLMQAAKQYNMPMEINLNGFKKGKVRRGLNLRYMYPFEEFWELAAKEGIDVVIGVDAHTPRIFAQDFPDCNAMLEKYDFNLLTEEDILARIDV